MKIRSFFGLGGPPARPPIRWVQQIEQNSCGVACLAMVLGVDYWEARSRVTSYTPEAGLAITDILRVLGENGWAYVEKHPHYSPGKRDRPRWPLPPFAPLHVCAVLQPGWHGVVMLGNGTVLDPLYPEPRALSQYDRVLEIAGLWPVA